MEEMYALIVSRLKGALKLSAKCGQCWGPSPSMDGYQLQNGLGQYERLEIWKLSEWRGTSFGTKTHASPFRVLLFIIRFAVSAPRIIQNNINKTQVEEC